MRPLSIRGGRALLPGQGLVRADIAAEGGAFSDRAAPPGALALDAAGLLVLPGIVDIHGDAFERQLEPRPGVAFPVDLALADTERQLLANGITTAFLGATLSWEPGLRSLDAWRALLEGLGARAWTCDMRVHLRFEAFNLDALDAAEADIAAGRAHLLAFNDHTPAILRKLSDPVEGAKYAARAHMGMAAFAALAERVAAGAPRVAAGRARLAASARAAGIPMLSHDDATLADRAMFRALGARVSEFPLSREVGAAARAGGDHVVMGCPNVVRGGSHLGWASAAALAEEGICDVLASDYYYPAMARAARIMAGRGVLDWERSWDLVSANPARAAGLADRGRIAPGARADAALLDPESGEVVATVAAGRIAYLSAEGARRLGGVE